MNDGAILARWVKERDTQAFRSLVERHSGMVYATCLRVLQSRAQAEDVSQECFATLSQVDRIPGDSLGPWLHRVATNLSLKQIRSDLRRKKREADFATAHAAQQLLAWDDICAHVDEAIDALPEKLRVPTVAHYVEGQTHAAIASRLNLPRQTVTSRVHRGVEEIRKSLGRKGISTTAYALAGMFGANLAEAASISPSLMATLEKVALAGSAPSGTASVGGGMSGAIGIAGVIAMKKIIVGAALVLVAGAGFWTLRPRDTAEEATQQDAMPTAGQIQQSEEAFFQDASPPSTLRNDSTAAPALTATLDDAETGREAERIASETVVPDTARAPMLEVRTAPRQVQVRTAAVEAEYVGHSKCKMCHNKSSEGEQWSMWKSMAHAQAYNVLLEERAREVAIAVGVTVPPAESPDCLSCHVTDYDAADFNVPASIAVEDGVQCESCHGPASLHLAFEKKYMMRKDEIPDDATRYIVRPDGSVCVECHNDRNPTWNPERYTTESGEQTDFDFEQAAARMAHPNPKKAQR